MASKRNKKDVLSKIRETQQKAATDGDDGANSGSNQPAADTKVRTVAVVPRRKWVFDEGGNHSEPHANNAVTPSGFVPGNFNTEEGRGKVEKADQKALVYQSAMGVAMGPGRQALMTAFMLWMSGNSLQIFSIMMLFMAFWGPVQKLINFRQEFARYADSNVDLTIPMLLFIATNLAALGVALYKCHAMGLLPTSAVDWVTVGPVKAPAEFSIGSIVS